jgi:hypothetical protein
MTLMGLSRCNRQVAVMHRALLGFVDSYLVKCIRLGVLAVTIMVFPSSANVLDIVPDAMATALPAACAISDSGSCASCVMGGTPGTCSSVSTGGWQCCNGSGTCQPCAGGSPVPEMSDVLAAVFVALGLAIILYVRRRASRNLGKTP